MVSILSYRDFNTNEKDGYVFSIPGNISRIERFYISVTASSSSPFISKDIAAKLHHLNKDNNPYLIYSDINETSHGFLSDVTLHNSAHPDYRMEIRKSYIHKRILDKLG